jgi:hypothetical protein
VTEKLTFLQKVDCDLPVGFATDEVLDEVRASARRIDKAPGQIGDGLRGAFLAWVHRMAYLQPGYEAEHARISRMPLDLADIDKGGNQANSDKRLARATDHLDAGWPLADVVCFITTQREYETVERYARLGAEPKTWERAEQTEMEL